MTTKYFNPEFVRPLDKMMDADPRWEAFGFVKSESSSNEKTIEDYSRPIYEISLNKNVPDSVKTHFETAKNLALYAWHVYRFNSVAELHAFISVEFALRKKTSNQTTPFKKLFKRAIDDGWFSNENFSQWKRISERDQRIYKESCEFAEYLGQPEPTEPECWNYLEVITQSIPQFRNNYAHGSSSIRPWVVSSLELCAEIINQIYPEKNGEDKG